MSGEGAAPLVLNVGCGARSGGALPVHFNCWREVRIDADPAMEPDITARLPDLSPVSSASADAVWAAHCIEHLYAHEVRAALLEFRRVLRDDGFACVVVPDLQLIAQYIATDRLHEVLYVSPAGPVTPHDILFGYGPAIAHGHASMAHHCGFTSGMLQQCFHGLPFGEIQMRRRSARLELMVLARVVPARDDAERVALMNDLQL